MPREQRYLSARDVADELGVSISKAYLIVRECTHVRSGRTIRVSRANFEAWKRRHEQRADEPRADAQRSPIYAALLAPSRPRFTPAD